ncbi:MAG: hypothetical protein Q4A80_05475, partial [Bacillota bacterium]|nr:hypothetical protein [Bacillota bacterium]
MNIGKKLLSLLTVFCLTLSLVPTVALAATSDATSVKVYGIEMAAGTGTTYYKNSSYAGSQGSLTEDSSNYNAKYESDTHTLT